MTHERYARFSIAVVAFNLLVIMWGAYVRATGSGAGCGNNWPLCHGQVIPRGAGLQTLIEFSHRTTSGLALLLVVALAVFAFKLYPPAHRVRRGAVATLIIILVEAALGAGLVLFELVADNASMARAMFMATHLGNTLLLLGAMTLTGFWANGGGGVDFGLKAPRRPLHPLAWATVVATVVVGMSGAVAALGHTLYPEETLPGGARGHLSATSRLFVQMPDVHPLIAIAGAGLMLYLVGQVRSLKRPETRFWATTLNVMVIVQLAAGSLNMFLHAPIWLQLTHLVLADLVWIALVLTCATALPALPATAAAPNPAAAPATRPAPAT